ncbi:phosphatase PAP2 family protein [Paractinoplanes hotanensis]|uniref:Phosphatase PAP2 family protein n=1 Tax=Paractinoplanes hotanensis TaxID=2906497 RepID=A0ABT0YF39_9ACTN|nr:phosphatase PAP2 family protein [Actinoplanes hotanensis]MCM4083884.1 phosphatase PAP2 family protein [Actinoplanes hotanensis]
MNATTVEQRPAGRFVGRLSVGLLAVAVAGVLFALLVVSVRRQWSGLFAVDRAVAAWFNDIVSGSRITVNMLRGVTEFGVRNMLTLVLVAATGYLLVRRQHRLAVYAVVTSLGALILDPMVKLLVERLRPVVDVPVATAPGPSFPSGHALGSLVSYGVLMLIFLPAVSRRHRTVLVAATATVIVAVGVTRIALGVHYLSDVLGGWALGVVWLGVTAVAFRHWRAETGRSWLPLSGGLAPEAAPQLRATGGEMAREPHRFRAAASLLIAAILVVGALSGVGVLVTAVLADGAVGRFDREAVAWFAALRSPDLTRVMDLLNIAGDTGPIITVTLGAGVLALAVFRSWRPVVFLWIAVVGEVVLFLTISTVVARARPAVQPLQTDVPETGSFPSGHVAGSLCLYTAIAVLVWQATGARAWRGLAVAAAVLLPAGVALARLYRGVHHPMDVVGSVLLAAAWVTAAWLILRPVAPRGRISSSGQVVGDLR